MACMVLPSETARLVYGYLVKEKLDNIALQFLENSPYLTDCCHIVKSGYQFNTKFLYKELHELLQEYSTIQNLVNKKVGLLSKTSTLYKRIKLQCENLSEIIDLILFWRYDESSSELNSPSDNRNSINENESKTDKLNELTVNSSNNHNKTNSTNTNNTSNNNNTSNRLLLQETECNNEYVSNNTPRIDSGRTENEIRPLEGTDSRLNSKYVTDKGDSNQTDPNINCMIENNAVGEVQRGANTDSDKYSEIQSQNQSDLSEISKDNGEMSISTNNSLNQDCVDKSNKIEISLIQNEPDVVNLDGHIKIVRIEKANQVSEDVNQQLNTFAQQLDGMESGMNMENGSVLYVTPDAGNITINQDKNQIIFIPIDYYKPQSGCQNDIGNGQGQVENSVGNITKSITANNEIIFEDVTVASSSVPTSSTPLSYNNSTDKKAFVDEDIVTEGTYLKDKDLLYELEDKVKPQLFQEAAPMTVSEPEPIPTVISAPIAAPLPRSTIFVSQVLEPVDNRYRLILPRKEVNYNKTPIVVVEPLVERNKGQQKSKPSGKTKGNGPKKVKRAAASSAKPETQESQKALSMPSIRTPAHESKVDVAAISPEEQKEAENREKINEEKENLETGEKATETPVVVLNKNPKRLSLSTPRRKSHIRALEFETPPKSGNEKKKSRTSPKAKVDEVKVKNKNVRNTLFKSPDLDTVFKTPSCLNPEKKSSPGTEDAGESAKESSLPAAEKSSFAGPSDTRELPLPQTSSNVPAPSNVEKKVKKSWDADLRGFISAGNSSSTDSANVPERKRTRKAKKSQKETKEKPKKAPSPKKSKTVPVVPTPSKMSLTAKRNTYSISGNEEGSPMRALPDELDLVTPFKDPEPVRTVEETPLTKLLRENFNGLDIDLNMINTPTFPPTPSIIITPDAEDSLSMAGTYYYTPLKDSAKEKVSKVQVLKNELMKVESSEAEDNRKRSAKETHEKVIGELVSKARELIGLRRSDEEHVIKKPPSGKVLSMVKIQMITQCDKKLCENIPINEEPVNEQETTGENLTEESAKFDLKCELEEKKQRALRKIKSVKENFPVPTRKRKMRKSPAKRKRPGDGSRYGKKAKMESPNTSGEGKSNDSSTGVEKEVEIYHSTPYEDKGQRFDKDDSTEKMDRTLLDEIREEFPAFEDKGDFPELPVKTRKKLHYIEHFLKSEDIVRYLENYGQKSGARLRLKRSHKKFFQVFYKWLRHPHAREVNTSDRTKSLFKEYRTLFEKIKNGVTFRMCGDESEKDTFNNDGGFPVTQCNLSDDDNENKQKTNAEKKEVDVEDGPVSILPLKKRKATVQPLELNGTEPATTSTDKTETPSQTQTFLQDIDVDRFLSQIHGQENR